MTSSDVDLTPWGAEQSVLKCLGKGHDPKLAEPGFSFWVSAGGLVLPASPVTPDSRRPGNGLPLCVPSVSCAWHMVGFSEYLWNHFLPTPLCVVSNTKIKRWTCSGSKCVWVWSHIFSLKEEPVYVLTKLQLSLWPGTLYFVHTCTHTHIYTLSILDVLIIWLYILYTVIMVYVILYII